MWLQPAPVDERIVVSEMGEQWSPKMTPANTPPSTMEMASGATRAQMAMAGIESRVPPDQVIDAMREVGASLPHTLRETGKGGLAATPFGKKYQPKED